MTPHIGKKARAAGHNPAAHFARPQDVLRANDFSRAEKRHVLERWKQEAIALQNATDENMTGGEPSRIDEVVEAINVLERAA